MLLGVTMADDGQRLFGGALPLDDVDSGDIDLAGRFAEFVQRLRARRSTCWPATARVDAWAEALAWHRRRPDASTARRDAWQRAELTRCSTTLVDEATTSTAWPARSL